MATTLGTTHIKGNTFTVKEFVGTVVEADKRMETVVSGGGGSSDGRVSSIRSTTYTHDRLFLVNNSGEEKVFEFTDVHINARAGHRIQVIWIIKKDNDRGSYISVKNLNTGDHRWIDEGIKQEVISFYGKIFIVIPFIVLVMLLAFVTFGLSLLLFVWEKSYEKKACKKAKEQLKPYVKSSQAG